MIKVILFVLLVYCVFAWGYGFALFLDVFSEIKQEKSEFRQQGKPVFLVPPILFILWIVFPLLWPVCEFCIERED